MMNVVSILTFLTVVAVGLGSYALGTSLLSKYRQERRLNKIADPFKADKKETSPELQAFNKKRKSSKREIKLIARIPLFGNLYRACVIYNYPWLTPLAFLVPFLVGYLLTPHMPIYVMPFGIKYTFSLLVSAFFCGRIAMFFAGKYQAKLDNNIPVLLDAITRGLRVGKSFTAVLEKVGDELEGPIKRIIEDIKEGLEVGVDPVEIFTEYGDSTGVESFHYIAALLAANQKSGGSMAPAFESLSNTIRAKKELIIKIDAMSQESKFTGYVMAILPFALVWNATAMKPELTENLWHTGIGNYVFIVVTFVVYIALLIMQFMSRMKV